ncbi:toprim domain-containing protein, partial [Lichenicoccus roseus]
PACMVNHIAAASGIPNDSSWTVSALAGLGIAEGIETALSVGQRVFPVDMWATASCGAMERLPVYPCVGTLHIFADRDPAEHGIKAARACAARWVKAGTDVRIVQPKAAGDWNDVAKEIAA